MIELLRPWLPELYAAGLATFAGGVAYLQQFRDPQVKWLWRAALIHCATSNLVGLLTFWLLSKRGIDENVLRFLIAVAGWGGVETIIFFQGGFRQLVGGAFQFLAARYGGGPPPPPPPGGPPPAS